ncbi:MAG TPA: transglycosylase domain-containing protein, partial [Thermomicrobiales bacterium]|nr:transglycosylase domain-containing protein [Thermomicrobiales bacterium]
FLLTSVTVVGATVRQYRDVNESLPNAAIVASQAFQTTSIYDRKGTLLQTVDQPEGGGWRNFVELDQISPYLIQATVASEDSTFWSHYGVEPIAIVRGATIILSGSGSSGGSTITQQLARGLYPDQIGTDYSISRKIREAMAAVAIEKEFSKTDILTMYLNLIFYGQRSYGIEAASTTYFQKHASELTLAEASMLAGLPQAPSNYDPTANFELAKKRQHYVLNQMVRYGYITQTQADKAFNTPLDPQTRNGSVRPGAEAFTQFARQYIDEHYPGALTTGGLKITTTLDVDLQATAQNIVSSAVQSILLSQNRNNAAMVVMVPWSGEVLAMVGSADFNSDAIGGQVNYAITPRQPGSSIKPLVYAAAFESGWNPGTVVMDVNYSENVDNPADPKDKVWTPLNYSGNFNGAVSVRTALANSYNIPAVKAIKFAGVEHALRVAQRMGLTSSLEGQKWYNLGNSFALGSGEVKLIEHTNAYATLANNGKFVPYNPILRIEDSQGNVLYDATRTNPKEDAAQAIDPGIAYQLTSILTDNQARSRVFTENNLFGNTQSELGRPTAAKSGTTDNWKDIWTMGYTTDVAIGVWAGYTSADGTSPQSLPEFDGIQGAGPIWQKMMLEIHSPQWDSYLEGPNGSTIADNFPVPADIYMGDVCAATGNQAADGYESNEEPLIKGSGPYLACDQLSAYQQSELDTAMNSLNKGPFTGGAVDSIYRYQSAADGNGDSVRIIESSDENGDFTTDFSEDEEPPIEPIESP